MVCNGEFIYIFNVLMCWWIGSFCVCVVLCGGVGDDYGGNVGY